MIVCFELVVCSYAASRGVCAAGQVHPGIAAGDASCGCPSRSEAGNVTPAAEWTEESDARCMCSEERPLG